MNREQIEEYLTKMYKHVNYSEDPNPEQAFYNNNITKIREAIERGQIDVAEITEEMLSDYINNGVDFSSNELDIEDEVEEDYDVMEYMGDDNRAQEDAEDFMKSAANKAILPQNSNIKNNWMSKAREWIKDKLNKIKNTFER